MIGELQPQTEDEATKLEFLDKTVGMNIPKSFIPAIEKGFLEACDRGEETCSQPSLAVWKIAAYPLLVLAGESLAMRMSWLWPRSYICRSVNRSQGRWCVHGAGGWSVTCC